MATARDVLGKLAVVLVVGAAAAGAYNVMSDNAGVLKSARLAMACPSESACQLSRFDRRPWEQRFELFQGARGKVVRCRPAMILVGEWRCQVTDETPAPPVIAR
jgi:hypothetical protein